MKSFLFLLMFPVLCSVLLVSCNDAVKNKEIELLKKENEASVAIPDNNFKRASDYYNRAHSKYDLKDYDGAIADYTKAIELDPNDASVYYNRANSKKYLKDYDGAIADYTKAIELDPNYASAYNNRGHLKNDLKDYYGAIADYTKAIKLDPNYSKAYHNRGISKAYLNQNYCEDFKNSCDLGNCEAYNKLCK